jgi:eukaryotic-like serine/threonine-protein kinase
MNAEQNPGARSAPDELGIKQKKGWTVSPAIGRAPSRAGSIESTRAETGNLHSLSLSQSGFWRDDPRVIAALEEYLEALQSGHLWSRAEFLARHSGIAEALGECLSGLEFIQVAGAQLVNSQASSTATDPSEVIPARARLGDFRIVREVGRGGMGVVYEAEQVSLGRRVALKVLPFAAAIDPKQRQRFQIEAQAAAQLQHPHIVPIFGVGCDQGIHYYAMQFVEGRSLAAILEELRTTKGTPGDAPTGVFTSGEPEPTGSLPPTAVGPVQQDRAFCRYVARLGAEAADALDHAHGLGILHRDIKPANLLIDPAGSLWITDFGLARLPSDLSLTHTGDMVGTLRYMSPEQALARRGVVDQRTDVYALGATLYELLTLRPAHDGRDHQELLRQIALDEPIQPRRLNPGVPRDLETIVLKAMAKDPSSRYPTAQELALDLRRFGDDRPILARRPGLLERSLRWALRHRELVATAAAIVVLATMIGTAATWAQARKTETVTTILHNYINQTYPLVDLNTVDAMGQATKSLSGPVDEPTREGALQVFERAINFYTMTSNLPPIDLESRTVVARSINRLGFARTVLSGFKRTKNGPDPGLLSQANADYRRSIALFETLLAEFPGDLKVRRSFAESLGKWGSGWQLLFLNQPKAAAPYYRRSVQLWRDLIRDANPGAASGGRASENLVGELVDLSVPAETVQVLAGILEDKGQVQEAEDLRQQLADDFAGLAARFSAPAFQAQRQDWAYGVVWLGQTALHENKRRDAARNYRLAILLDTDHALAHNNLAWLLVSLPSDPAYDPIQGLALARKAVALEPNKWQFMHTMGVAAFRARDWKTGTEFLQKSASFTGGQAYDFFFLAMIRWHQGQKQEARKLYDQAVAWTDANNPGDFELRQFHAEAAALMGLPCPKPESRTREVEKGWHTSGHARQNTTRSRKHLSPLIYYLSLTSQGNKENHHARDVSGRKG